MSSSDSTSCPLPIVPGVYDNTHSEPVVIESSIQSSPVVVYTPKNHSASPLVVIPHSTTLDSSPLPIVSHLPKEATQHPEWRAAMEVEIQALETNQTWKLTPLPAEKKAIGCKWVYKTKLRADGSVERYKTRLVAKGYNQVEGIDYTDSFSPVAKAVTMRLFLTLVAANGWALQQLDVNNAFLHGHLDEDIYMTPPDGYPVKPSLVCKLERSLYRLKQASRQWNVELTVQLQKFGFIQSVHDHFLFILHTARDTGLKNAKSVCTPFPQARHVVRYLKSCPSKGLFLPATNSLVIKGYYDADWACCIDSRRSLIGFCIFLGDALISWKTKKQTTVSHSTAEAEYRSLATTVCELRWISYLLIDFGVTLSLPIDLFCDNKAALHILANPVFHEHTKHI
ncbi:UNVERIFIED_CONTAM: Retrovirus-related Pol polyprotein from transposon RE1 [Sesamum radiatum]|uniref:Retrovirus-related Pol polyprotein from transposon RE1 n=1 Tax=Sesamum radiatum TaxID=300843 RepID=A0AAW2THD9_SESRA